MNNYKRIISYLYYYGNSEKKNNVGYVRMERKDGICKVTIHMRSINSNDKKLGVYFFYRKSEQLVGISLGTMVIKKGVGEFRKVIEEEITKGLQVTLEEMGGIIIYENNEHFFATQWDDEFINIMNFYIANENDEKEWNREQMKEKERKNLQAANLMEVQIEEVEQKGIETEEALEVSREYVTEENFKIEGAGNEKRELGIDREDNTGEDLRIEEADNGRRELGIDRKNNTGGDLRIEETGNGKRELGIDRENNTDEDLRIEETGNEKRELGIDREDNAGEDLRIEETSNGKRELGIDREDNAGEDLRIEETGNGKRELGIDREDNAGEGLRIEEAGNGRRELGIGREDNIGKDLRMGEENNRSHYTRMEKENIKRETLGEEKIHDKENGETWKKDSKRSNLWQRRENHQEENIRIVSRQSDNLREKTEQYAEENLKEKEAEDRDFKVRRERMEQGKNKYSNYSRISRMNEAIERFSARTNRKFQTENMVNHELIRNNIKSDRDENIRDDNNIREYVYKDKRIENQWRQQVRNQQRKLEQKMELAEKLFEKFPSVDTCNKEVFKKCVKIEPQDIGNFPMETWVLANNSFLLHGYYQYKYLIFALHFHEKQWEYVIGVPGIYEPKERFMAGMFGFGNFCPANDEETRVGIFGYWYQVIRL